MGRFASIGLTLWFAVVAPARPQDAPRTVDATTNEPHPPVVPAPPPDARSLNKSLLRFVEDDAPPRGEDENPDENRAYDYVIGFARNVPAESFARAARTDITFAHMMGPEAARYRGEVVRIEGRLKRVRDIGPTPALEADGVKHLYEAWIFSEIYKGYSYCVLLTELPPGIPVAEQLDRKVTFEGYFYKVYKFRAGDGIRRAPLLIGRSMTERKREPLPPSLADEAFLTLPVLLCLLVGSVTVAAGVVVGFKIADRRTKARLEVARGKSAATIPTPDVFHDPNPMGGSPSLN